MDSATAGPSTMAPGPNRRRGSKASLTATMAAYRSGPSRPGSAQLRERPTPCSPEIAPWYSAAVGRLAAEYHGAISGEHGVGRSRSWALPGLLGPDLYAAMVAVKDAFDPRRLLGPGAIVDGPAVAESLRYGADYRGDGAWAPRLSYAAEGGFDLAVEKCFGAGLCKKLTGTMCPPAAASRSEAYTTRARASALQGVGSGARGV